MIRDFYFQFGVQLFKRPKISSFGIFEGTMAGMEDVLILVMLEILLTTMTKLI
jgi:hypothetical protein